MKTKEELSALKVEVDTLNKKLAELTEDELERVNGGAEDGFRYVFKQTDKIWADKYHGLQYIVLQDVATDDGAYMMEVKEENPDYPVRWRTIPISVSSLNDLYLSYGGTLKAR